MDDTGSSTRATNVRLVRSLNLQKPRRRQAESEDVVACRIACRRSVRMRICTARVCAQGGLTQCACCIYGPCHSDAARLCARRAPRFAGAQDHLRAKHVPRAGPLRLLHHAHRHVHLCECPAPTLSICLSVCLYLPLLPPLSLLSSPSPLFLSFLPSSLPPSLPSSLPPSLPLSFPPPLFPSIHLSIVLSNPLSIRQSLLFLNRSPSYSFSSADSIIGVNFLGQQDPSDFGQFDVAFVNLFRILSGSLTP